MYCLEQRYADPWNFSLLSFRIPSSDPHIGSRLPQPTRCFRSPCNFVCYDATVRETVHETFTVDEQWLWDHVVQFVRWQHPAIRPGKVWCAWWHLFRLIYTINLAAPCSTARDEICGSLAPLIVINIFVSPQIRYHDVTTWEALHNLAAIHHTKQGGPKMWGHFNNLVASLQNK